MLNRDCSEDICLWPNGDWCYGEELESYMRNKSDDFERIRFGTPAWDAFDKD
jgi:hypothetical protein